MNLSQMGNFTGMNSLTNITESIKAGCGDSINTGEIIKSICNQYERYIRKLGFSIIIGYIVVNWGCWWFFNHGYKRFGIHSLDDINTRIEWDQWIRHIFTKWAVGFIAVVIWLSF